MWLPARGGVGGEQSRAELQGPEGPKPGTRQGRVKGPLGTKLGVEQ